MEIGSPYSGRMRTDATFKPCGLTLTKAEVCKSVALYPILNLRTCFRGKKGWNRQWQSQGDIGMICVHTWELCALRAHLGLCASDGYLWLNNWLVQLQTSAHKGTSLSHE